MHLRDLLSVGLIDEIWSARFPELLAERLRVKRDSLTGWAAKVFQVIENEKLIS